VATPRLVADIGGTNARFAIVDGADHRPRDVRVVRCADHADVGAALRNYLAAIGGPPPTRACLAVAAAVEGDAVSLTNGPWSFSQVRLQRELGLDVLLVVNDFAAQAAALSELAADDVMAIANPRLPGRETRAIMGPGTGLGIAAAVPCGDGWSIVSGEGGHTGFAPVDDLEARVWAIVAGRHGRVSNERLLSGSGLVEIHAALSTIDGRAAKETTAETITSLALDGSSPRCRHTVRLFWNILASVAGDTALYFGATGGVYMAGGIVPRIVDLLDADGFRRRFAAKGRMTAYASKIPIYVVTTPHSGLIGTSVLLDRVSD
jgi:glucokinase